MKNKKGQVEIFLTIVIVLLLAIGFGFAFYYVYTSDNSISNENETIINSNGITGDSNEVVRVIDGDTIVLTNGNKVRLICINTPEKGEYFYNESTEYLKELVLNKVVVLEKDVSETDRYDRLLRWVWINNELVNQKIVKNGYGRYAKYQPDVKYCDAIQQSEIIAQQLTVGMWTIK